MRTLAPFAFPARRVFSKPPPWDEFTVAESGPMVTPHICDNAGTLTLFQTDGNLSVSSGKLNFPVGVATFGGLGFQSTAPPNRVTGRALKILVRFSALSTAAAMGWYTVGIGTANMIHAIRPQAGIGWRLISNAAATQIALGASTDIATGVDYTLYIVQRGTGCFHFVQGGPYTSLTLLWVEDVLTTNVSAAFSNSVGAGAIDYFRVVDLASLDSRFATDFGFATSHFAGSVSAGPTFTHVANCVLDWTLTTRPSAGNVDLKFRISDASNYWIARVNSSGDFSLQEVVAGSATQRANAAGVVSSGHRLLITADGSTIRGYSNNTQRWSYASATNFATKTDGELNSLGTGGVVSNLQAWPRTATMAV